MTDRDLSVAVTAYIWTNGSALPGRHPDRVSDPDLLARVEALMRELDAVRPDDGARDLATWAAARASALADAHGGLAPTAVRALRDLLAWMWR
jgi:hypothetical protein